MIPEAPLEETEAGAPAPILFEEGDPLHGRRTQVSTAQDRYANLGIGYLLD